MMRGVGVGLLALFAAASLPSSLALAFKPDGDRHHCRHRQSTSTRRETLQKSLVASLPILVGSNPTANAFSNKISTQYDDRPRQRGSKPKGLGVGRRTDMAGEEYWGLKPCGASPNCFCSTDNVDDSPDTSIPPFIFPANLSREEAFQQLSDVVKSYEPGQSNIDGGGFDIVTNDPQNGYIYVQFESLKNGYIDDVELASLDEKSNKVQVRSSSRLGFLDFGVNSKRVNAIAKGLRSMGWEAEGVAYSTHKGYAIENRVTW
mmetsp:Transcript_21669/g.50998  ORF Transcript_21669/g.50998 Transcript_21669/m.50998 type:complete len:261 (+) Transcript_21669:68-850(+)